MHLKMKDNKPMLSLEIYVYSQKELKASFIHIIHTTCIVAVSHRKTKIIVNFCLC